MSTVVAPSKKQAFDSSIRLPINEIVVQLRDLLGAKLVAYVAGVSETRAVRAWAEGSREPNPTTESVLRHAHRVSFQIVQSEGEAVVPVWFQGMNPHLGDKSPARVLREGDFEQEAPRVLAAADDFVGA